MRHFDCLLHLVPWLRINGDIRLLPRMCHHGVDRDFTFMVVCVRPENLALLSATVLALRCMTIDVLMSLFYAYF